MDEHKEQMELNDYDFREPVFIEKFDDSEPDNEKEEDITILNIAPVDFAGMLSKKFLPMLTVEKQIHRKGVIICRIPTLLIRVTRYH